MADFQVNDVMAELQVKGDQNELVFGFWPFECRVIFVSPPSEDARAQRSSTLEFDNEARMIQGVVLSVVGSRFQG